MVINKFDGPETPLTINNYLKNNTNWKACWDDIGTLENYYNITPTVFDRNDNGLNYTTVSSVFTYAISRGEPIVVGLKKSNGETHFVLVKGYGYSGTTLEFSINDPESAWDYSYLSQYINSGWKVYSYKAFK